MPNPTIHGVKGLGDLDPVAFQALNASLVLFAPDIYWDNLVKVRCPLCKEIAKPHGWSPQLRRVMGLSAVWFVASRRYKCNGCKGTHPLGTESEVGYNQLSAVAGWFYVWQ